MPKAATGNVFLSRGVWYARVTLDAGKRKAFKLAEETEGAARVRLAALSELATKLRADGHGERAEAFLAEAAFASPEDLKAVLQIADALCRGDAVPIKPKASGGGITIADLAEQWTSGQLAAKYPDDVPLKDNRHRDEGLIAKHILPLVGDLPVVNFTIEHAELVKQNHKGAASSRRQLGGLLARILNIAVYPLRLISASPIPRGFFGRIGGKASKAMQCLYPDEDRKLLACRHVPLRLRMYYGFLAREGMRASEAEALRWSDIDLARGGVTLDANKTDDPRAWALSPGVVRAMTTWRAMLEPSDDAMVFPDISVPRRSRHFRRYLRMAGVTREVLFTTSETRRRIRAHDLRATFITIALANGKTEAWISDRTGHRSSTMINRYRRTARTVAELGLGDLLPLDEAIPEFSTGSNIGSDAEIVEETWDRASCGGTKQRLQPGPISTKRTMEQGGDRRKSGPVPSTAADRAAVSPAVVLPFSLPPVHADGDLALAASWALRLVAAEERQRVA